MKWEEVTRGKVTARSDSAAGYVVAGSRTPSGAIVYCAFGPDRGREWLNEQMRDEYALGEAVPTRREHLGCWPDDPAAKQACEEHNERQQHDGDSN